MSICQEADLRAYFPWIAAALGAAYALAGRVTDAVPLLMQASSTVTIGSGASGSVARLPDLKAATALGRDATNVVKHVASPVVEIGYVYERQPH